MRQALFLNSKILNLALKKCFMSLILKIESTYEEKVNNIIDLVALERKQ